MGRRGRSISVDVDIDLDEFDDDVIIEYAQELIDKKIAKGQKVAALRGLEDSKYRELVDNQADLMKLEHFMSVMQDFSLSEIEERLKK